MSTFARGDKAVLVGFFFLSEFLHDFGELDKLSRMLLFNSVQFRLGAKESFTGLSELRESVVDHLLVSCSVDIPQVFILFDFL